MAPINRYVGRLRLNCSHCSLISPGLPQVKLRRREFWCSQKKGICHKIIWSRWDSIKTEMLLYALRLCWTITLQLKEPIIEVFYLLQLYDHTNFISSGRNKAVSNKSVSQAASRLILTFLQNLLIKFQIRRSPVMVFVCWWSSLWVGLFTAGFCCSASDSAPIRQNKGLRRQAGDPWWFYW